MVLGTGTVALNILRADGHQGLSGIYLSASDVGIFQGLVGIGEALVLGMSS